MDASSTRCCHLHLLRYPPLFPLAGAAVYTVYGSAEQQDFSNNADFGFESLPAFKALKQLPFTSKSGKDE